MLSISQFNHLILSFVSILKLFIKNSLLNMQEWQVSVETKTQNIWPLILFLK